MLLIQPPELDSLEPAVRTVYETGKVSHAHFDELRKALTRFPPVLLAADGMYDLIVGQGRLDSHLKEAMIVACSAVRNCTYGVAAHSRRLISGGSTPDEVQRLAQGEPLAIHSEADQALLSFARKVAAAPYKTVEGDIESLRRAGFDERTIIEALTVVSLSGWMNGYALALGLDQNDAVPLSGGNPWP